MGEKAGLFEFGRPNRIVYDYSADGALRSIQDSLKRLGVDGLDFVWIHDIARDFHGDEWLAQFDTARKGAFRALTRLREQGVIKAWGLGVNRVAPCELTLDLTEAHPDGFLLAGRYTLLDHERALQRLMPAAAARKVDIGGGGPYSSGVLAGGTHFEYQKAPPEILAKVDRIKAVARRHQVPIKAAALQFALAHPASAAVIPGASRPERIAEDHAALTATILEAPFPVTGYRSTLRVREANGGKGSRVEWSGEFTPDGVSDREAAQLFQSIYEDGLKALAARFVPEKK